MMLMIYVAALIVSALLASTAVLTDKFNDNILQRMGLAVVAFAAFAEMYLLYQASECCKFHNTRTLFVIGFAIYAIGTALKVFRHNRERT